MQQRNQSAAGAASNHHHHHHLHSTASNPTITTDPSVLHKFQAGFADCTDEVNRYITQMDGVDTSVKQRLIGHLSSCVGGLQQISNAASPFTTAFATGYRNSAAGLPSFIQPSTITAAQLQQPPAVAAVTTSLTTTTAAPITTIAQDINNNSNNGAGRIHMNGVQLIPSRLPTGELALVMPNSSNLPYFPSFSSLPTTISSVAASATDLLAATSDGSTPRISAFNSVKKPIAKHVSSAPHSPPPSPVSSDASGEDSMPSTDNYQSMSLSTTSTTTTPPLQSMSAADLFPTPPSGVGISLLQVVGPLTEQQHPQISSTTEARVLIKPLSVITNVAATARGTEPNSKKRSAYQANDGESVGLLQLASSEEPARKMFKVTKMNGGGGGEQKVCEDGSDGDMWRPW